MRLVCGADDDQPVENPRISLGKCEGNHSAVRGTDDSVDVLDADFVEGGNDGVGLIVRADDSFGATVGSAAAVNEVAPNELILRGVERATAAGDRFPPARRWVDAIGADVTVG